MKNYVRTIGAGLVSLALAGCATSQVPYSMEVNCNETTRELELKVSGVRKIEIVDDKKKVHTYRPRIQDLIHTGISGDGFYMIETQRTDGNKRFDAFKKDECKMTYVGGCF